MYAFIIFIISFSCSILTVLCGYHTPKIAVVGGGIGGTSCAYFLKQVFKENAHITLFERDALGGRLNLINIDGDYYESGGAVIHPSNKYMVEFTKLLGLSLKQPGSSKFGIYDGDTFVFKESDWLVVTMSRFFWRYGFSAHDIWKDVKAMLKDFSRIYELQEKEYAFTTVSGMLEYMSPYFRNLTQETLQSDLLKKKYSKLFLEEIVQSVMMVNYGQTNNISAFAGFVSLAGSDNNLWQVRGGNKLVPEGLLEKSKALAVNGDVIEIMLLSNGTYSLTYNETSLEGKIVTEIYDIIILAAPLIKGSSNIRFTNFEKSFDQYETTFHRTVATFIKGNINPLAFNSHAVPEEILTFKNTLLFNSVGKVGPVNDIERKGYSDVYKIFSQHPLTQKSINSIFSNVEITKQKDWLAYPHYNPPEHLPPFMLYPGLYYINAIELAASAMEMSALAGKNVALLAFNLWHNNMDKVDHYKRMYKDEL